MTTDKRPKKPPELAKLEAVLEHCRKREVRARERLERADIEVCEASGAVDNATVALAKWLAAHPDPQGALFDGETQP